LGGSLQNIKIGMHKMASEITSLLQHGWENLWKNRVLWLFSFLVLIEPFLRLIIPIPQNANLPSSLLNLVVGLASVYFGFLSTAGILFVAYCIAIDKFVDMGAAFQNSTNLFWRVVGISFLLVLIIAPCLFTVFIVFYQEPFQIANLAHAVFFLSLPLSIFAAMWYFPITEIIASDSKIGKSIQTAWSVFTHNFVSLAIIGFVLAIASYITNVSISMVTMLAQNSFDFAVLSKLDIISPHLSVTDNSVHKLLSTIAQAVWRTYSISIFTFAYLKYSGAKMSKHSTS
jgi:hypothetical protein